MTALDNNPSNKNFLSPFGFKFQIKKCPTVNFFVQSVNIPSIDFPQYDSPNPFVKIPYGGDHLNFGDLNLTFKVDEDLTNYLEIYNWIKGIAFPDQFDQYKQLKDKPVMSGEGLISDISLLILTSSRNPKYDVVYKDAFPVSLSQIEFNTTMQDVNYLTASCSFKYRSYEITTV